MRRRWHYNKRARTKWGRRQTQHVVRAPHALSVRRRHRGLPTDGCFATSSHDSRTNDTVVIIVGKHDESTTTYDDCIGGIVSVTISVIIVGRHDDSYDDGNVSINDATDTSNRSVVIVGTQDGSARFGGRGRFPRRQTVH